MFVVSTAQVYPVWRGSKQSVRTIPEDWSEQELRRYSPKWGRMAELVWARLWNNVAAVAFSERFWYLFKEGAGAQKDFWFVIQSKIVNKVSCKSNFLMARLRHSYLPSLLSRSPYCLQFYSLPTSRIQSKVIRVPMFGILKLFRVEYFCTTKT